MKLCSRIMILFVVLFSAAVPAFAQGPRTERLGNREVVAREILVRFRGANNATALSQAVRDQDPDILQSSPVGRSGAIRISSRGRDVSSLLRAYANRPDVEYAEPNFVWRAADIPNDSFFGDQWALQNTGQSFSQAGTAGADIKATQAWDVAEGSRTIVVGMIDSGIEYTHPDLVENIWFAPSSFSVIINGQTIQCAAGTHGFNAITRSCDPMDDDGHGTHTAGIVGARGNSGLGVSGVSRVANIMALKFLDSTGQGTTANAIAAIEFAIQVKKKFPTAANVRVLNASWGGGAFSQALLDEINLAGANDILFVTSAGNVAQNNDTIPQYPASYNASNLIAVAATNNRDQLADFSNFGAGTVHLGAPGVDVLSTSRGQFYTRQTGTSAAAPMVSGAAALILSACALDTAALKANILGSVDAVSSLSGLTTTAGRLNVDTAIRNCAGSLPPSFTLSVTPAAQTIAFGSGDQFQIAINALNGFNETITLSAANLPPGMSANFSTPTLSTGSSTVSIGVNSQLSQGTYFIRISATTGAIIRSAGIVVTVGVPATCAVDSNTGRVNGMLAATDAASLHRPPAFADFCTFVLDGPRAINIEMSAGFTSPFIYLLSNSGELLATGSTSGKSATIVKELAAGTYTIEATSSGPGLTGNYTLYVRNTPPTLSSISPTSGMAGTSIDITIKGTAFVGSPFLVKISSCLGVIVTNINVLNSTTAIATLLLPGTVVTCGIAVSTPGGTSSAESLRIFPPPPIITGVSPNLGIQGQTISITLTGTNFVSPIEVYLTDPQPLNTGIQLLPTAVTSTSVSLNWTISVNAIPGQHRFRVKTEGGVSNEQNFTILVSPPTLTTLFPFSVGRGMSVDVDLAGSGFSVPLQIDAGPEIAVSNVTVVSFSIIHATFTASAAAAFGEYPVTVTTALGTTTAKIFKVLPPPTMTSFTPSNAFQGRTRLITVVGTNFGCPLQPKIDGSGIQVTTFSNICTETSAGITLVVSDTAPLGPRTLTLTGTNGTLPPITISILIPPGILDKVSPPYGAQGTTVVVTLTGFAIGNSTVDVSGAGVVVTTLNSSFSSVTASLSIAADAAVGPRNISITNQNGTSDPLVFSVTPPTWPDLAVQFEVPPELGAGWDETLVIAVRNEGTKESSAPITVKRDWGSQFTQTTARFLSYSGDGWGCTLVENRFMTCTNSQSIAVNAKSSLSLLITMPDDFVFFQSYAEVSSPEDYNTANNSRSLATIVVFEPRPRVVASSRSLEPGQQGTISITVPNSFPHELDDPLNDVVTMSFLPLNPGTPTDSALQFATGGQRVSYSLKANSFTATIAGVTGPLGFQAGTVAGSITFTVTHRTKLGKILTSTTVVNVDPRPPTISAIVPAKQSTGFDTAITMFSSTREVASLTFRFPSGLQLTCGSVQGCSTSGSAITFNVGSLFNDWYAANTNFGTLALVRVPFNVQGSISGSVSVTLTNTQGTSNTMSFNIP